MKRIVECLLEAGILEEDIHRILDMIEEEYEIVERYSDETLRAVVQRYGRKWNDADNEVTKLGGNNGWHGVVNTKTKLGKAIIKRGKAWDALQDSKKRVTRYKERHQGEEQK